MAIYNGFGSTVKVTYPDGSSFEGLVKSMEGPVFREDEPPRLNFDMYLMPTTETNEASTEPVKKERIVKTRDVLVVAAFTAVLVWLVSFFFMTVLPSVPDPGHTSLVEVKVLGVYNIGTLVETFDGQRVYIGNPGEPHPFGNDVEELKGKVFVIRRNKLPPDYEPFTGEELFDRMSFQTPPIDLDADVAQVSKVERTGHRREQLAAQVNLEKDNWLIEACYEYVVGLDVDESLLKPVRGAYTNWNTQVAARHPEIRLRWKNELSTELKGFMEELCTLEGKPLKESGDWMIEGAYRAVMLHTPKDGYEVIDQNAMRTRHGHWRDDDNEYSKRSMLRDMQSWLEERERAKRNDPRQAAVNPPAPPHDAHDAHEATLMAPTFYRPLFLPLRQTAFVTGTHDYRRHQNVRVIRTNVFRRPL